MKVEKRDGRIVEFDEEKIHIAIQKAFEATTGRNANDSDVIPVFTSVIARIEALKKEQIGIEEIQDIVESVLIELGHTDVVRKFILYRRKRQWQRNLRDLLGVVDDLKLGVNAATVMKQRYLLRDKDRKVIETPSEMFRRVAKTIAKIDRYYDKDADLKLIEEMFYRMMVSLEFEPNSPVFFNAGTELGTLSACFVVPIEDNIESIFNGIRDSAIITKAGGGIGYSFSKLRPAGDVVGSTGGIASGPISFMRAYDAAIDVIKQGGRRRGALMGCLRCDHPDILEFIDCKRDKKSFKNFNISVLITDKFMEAYMNNEDYDLVCPRTGETLSKISARMVMDHIVNSAWATGDPGMIFIDRVNEAHQLRNTEIIATNPCGEVPLEAWGSCNLGSINLSKFVKDGGVDYKRLKEVVRLAVHFLDNVIDANKYPLQNVEITTKESRKIGLGVMGFAEMLIQLGIPYDSKKAIKTAEEVMEFIDKEGHKASTDLAKIRGNFPAFKLYKRKFRNMRNATITTIAPTGTISIIAGTSSGIEPLFAISYARIMVEGIELMETNKFFIEMAKKAGIWNKELELKIAKTGSVQNVEEVPEKMKKIFKTAHEITPEWHVRVQAAFQKFTSNAVSKTVNLPNRATHEDVKRIYLLAWELGCKGISVFRDGCLGEQVLYIPKSEDNGVVKCELDDPSCPKCNM